MDDKKLEFSGFVFKNEDELNAAKKEAAGIEHINLKIDYSDKDSLYSVYLKLIEKNLFKTVIGIEFLKIIRYDLIEKGLSEDDIPAVPVMLQSVIKEEKKVSEDIKKVLSKKNKKNKDNKRPLNFKKPFFYSLIVIAVLVLVMIFGIKILTNSENLNIINYQDRLQEKYESWEADLIERERILNESTLDINYDNIEDTEE